MSQLTYFGGAGGSPLNEDTDYEFVAFGVQDQGGVSLGSAGVTNTKGTPVQVTAATADDWAGFDLIVFSNLNVRSLIDISISGNSFATPAVPNLYMRPSAGGAGDGRCEAYIPLNVPAASDIYARIQNPSTGVNTPVAIRGRKRSAKSPPCFDVMEALVSGSTTHAGATVSMTNSVVWTEIVASTSQTYGALLTILGEESSITANKKGGLRLAVGSSGSEVEFWRQTWRAATGNPLIRSDGYRLIEKTIPAGSRISACVITDMPNSDTASVGLWGFR